MAARPKSRGSKDSTTPQATLEATPSTPLVLNFERRQEEFDARVYSAGGDEALVLMRKGTRATEAVPLVAIHEACPLGDVFHSALCLCHERLQNELAAIIASDNGALIYSSGSLSRRSPKAHLQLLAAHAQGLDATFPERADFAFAARVLKDLQFTHIRLLVDDKNEAQFPARDYGIAITETMPAAKHFAEAKLRAGLGIASDLLAFTRGDWMDDSWPPEAHRFIPSLLLAVYTAHFRGKRLSKRDACIEMRADPTASGPKYIEMAEERELVQVLRKPPEDRRKDFVLATDKLIRLVYREILPAFGASVIDGTESNARLREILDRTGSPARSEKKPEPTSGKN